MPKAPARTKDEEKVHITETKIGDSELARSFKQYNQGHFDSGKTQRLKNCIFKARFPQGQCARSFAFQNDRQKKWSKYCFHNIDFILFSLSNGIVATILHYPCP